MLTDRPSMDHIGRSAPYPASAIANFFLRKSRRLTQMQLHKLLYYAHGWHLAMAGEPLIDETIGAWKHGPVVPSLYYEFKKFGAQPIDQLAKRFDRTTQTRVTPRVPAQDHVVRSLLERIWQVYGGLSGLRLSQMTHAPGTPWSAVRGAEPDIFGAADPQRGDPSTLSRATRARRRR